LEKRIVAEVDDQRMKTPLEPVIEGATGGQRLVKLGGEQGIAVVNQVSLSRQEPILIITEVAR